MTDIKQKVLEELRELANKGELINAFVDDEKGEIELPDSTWKAIDLTIQECNRAFRKECKECEFKDIDQKIFAELVKIKNELKKDEIFDLKPTNRRNFIDNIFVDIDRELKQKFGVNEKL